MVNKLENIFDNLNLEKQAMERAKKYMHYMHNRLDFDTYTYKNFDIGYVINWNKQKEQFYSVKIQIFDEDDSWMYNYHCMFDLIGNFIYEFLDR